MKSTSAIHKNGATLNNPQKPRRTSTGLVRITLFLSWLTLLWMLAGPPVNLPLLPASVQFYDVLWGIATCLGVLQIHRYRTISSFRGGPLLAIFFVYVMLLLLIPLIGIVLLPRVQLDWYLGDLRWLNILLIAILMLLSYERYSYDYFHRHLTIFLVALAAVNLIVLLAQIRMQVYGGSAPFVLKLWYGDGEGAYGRYGFHINRYAGAMTVASGLGVVGAICFLVGVFGHREGWWAYLLGVGGLLFVLSSGSRMLVVGLIVLLPIVFFLSGVLRKTLPRVKAGQVAFVIVTLGGVMWAVVQFNLGRIVSSKRFLRVWDWFTGQATFEDVSGRGGDRWMAPIQQAQEWSALGTLVNPSHALSHLPPFDSYYVYLIAQAGPVLFPVFVILLGSLFLYAWKAWQRDRVGGALPMAVIITVLLVSITQNLMTGLTGRVFLMLAVVQVVLYVTLRPDTSRRMLDETI